MLWLNLVTNGIQNVALAFEPTEGDELKRSLRPPNEPLFDYSMIAHVGISALVMGLVAFWIFQDRVADDYTLEAARNSILLLMVLFENLQVFNSRSEWRSVFLHNPLRNPVLLLGVLASLALHIGAMYTSPLQEILQLQPIPLTEWLRLSGYALGILATMEIYKALWWWRQSRAQSISINKPPISHSPAAPTMRARPDRQADARRRWR